jgi:UDP-glucose 4-epimerase
MKNIIVTGGAGYIGSFMTKRLLDDGYQAIVIDNLERGHRESVDSRAELHVGNILDKQFLNSVFSRQQVDGVIHFAGYISVGESMQHPDSYFQNNTFGSLCLLEQMRMSKVPSIIFSSTAGIYGNPDQTPIKEESNQRPESPYGESKLLVEHGLSWYQKTFSINFASLRYFNAAGAALDGSMGENHPNETHIIPNVIQAAKLGSEFHLFGTDYPTEDGTCVRDYIHVLDLVDAHILALKKLEKESGGFYYNVGTGKGYSNKQIIDAVRRISGKEIKTVNEPRRTGDVSILVADNTKIKAETGFNPQYSDLDTIVKTAWQWHTKASGTES